MHAGFAGHGAPLVLLHAFPLSRSMWNVERALLSASFRVITPDLPGFGDSPVIHPPTIEGMAKAVWALLDRDGLTAPAIVGGLSMGGYVAFEMLRQAPQRVRGLGLFSTKAAADTPPQRDGRMKLIERIRGEGVSVLLQQSLPKLLGATTHTTRPELVQRVHTEILKNDPQGVIDALQAMADRRDSTDLLASIACPTLIIAGAEDELIPSAQAQEMQQRIRGAQLVILPHAGHLANLEDPPGFQAALTRWLEPLRTT